MADHRHHRGPHPEDLKLFAPELWPRLREATGDLSWLLERGYAIRSASELVGNRYDLEARQRLAMARCACSQRSQKERHKRELDESALVGQELWIDGLNVLTGLEVALSGGVILLGRDGCYRDIAGVHRQYRPVSETGPSLRMVGEFLHANGVRKCVWWLDKPVSNSGRLKQAIVDLAGQDKWPWEAQLVYNPDAVLSRCSQVVATSDSVILERCERWFNLLVAILRQRLTSVRLVDLSGADSPSV